MGLNKYHNEYQRNDISTSSQGKLILMMYEGAMKFTKMAIQCMDKGDIAGKGLYIQKTHDIVIEFLNGIGDGYNEIIEFLNQELSFDVDLNTSGTLFGNFTVQNLQQTLRDTISRF